MTSRDFCYWLQGYFELSNKDGLTKEQVDIIRAHLAMVFIHEIDPSFPQNQQAQLNEAHDIGSTTMGEIKPSWLDENNGMRC